MKVSPAFFAVALAFAGCASDHLPSDARTISLAPSARQAPVVLAPARASSFARMANERGTSAVNQLRSAIAREIAAGGRFQASPVGSGDVVMTIDSLRHGLIEVSANSYAVSVAGSVSITRGEKSLGTREFSGMGGDIRP